MTVVQNSPANKNGYSLLFEKKYSEAFDYFLADKESPDAQFMLAEFHRLGLGVEKNQEQAFHYYSQSAAQNYSMAFLRLGESYLYGDGVGVDYRMAHDWLSKALKSGEEMANRFLGEIYLRGLGTQKDIDSAVVYLERAVNTSKKAITLSINTDANRAIVDNASKLLALAYGEEETFTNLSSLEKWQRQVLWQREAAQHGNIDSKIWLMQVFGLRGIDSEKNMVDEFDHSVYMQILDDSVELSKKILEQPELFDSSEIEAIQKILKDLLTQDAQGADQKDPIAEYWMGFRYWNGIGVEQDLKKSFDLIHSSASKGFFWAEISVAAFYLDGDGTPIQVCEAIKYAERAYGKHINQNAGFILGRAHESPGSHQNFKKSYNYYESAPTGRSFYRLGNFNECGKGCEIDLLKAKEFYIKASEAGVYGAKLALATWALLGVDQPEDLAKADELLSEIPFGFDETIKKWQMLVYVEKKYANRDNDKQISLEVDTPELAYTCSDYCWNLLNSISNQQSIYSENVCHLLCERGLKWFLVGLRSVGSKPKTYSKELVGRAAASHLNTITKILGKGLSYKDAYALALDFYLLGYESECVPVLMALAKAGIPFPQFMISQYYKAGKYIPTNYLNSYAWLNLASSKLENTTIKDGLKELESLLGSQNIIQAQILSQQYQERFDPSLIGNLSAHKSNALNSQELLILSTLDSKTDPSILGHFVNNAFNTPIFNSEDSIDTENANKSMFLTLLKFFLLLPIAALCAYLIYIFGSGLLTYLLVKI